MTDAPKTLIAAVAYFSDPKVCNDYMRQVKWPDGPIICPKCQSENVGEIASRHKLQCKSCRKQFSYKVGTIFEDSPLPLSQWFVAVWCIANHKNGISSHELGRALGVTQKTAWFMLHRIREAMRTGSFKKLSGEVESDETFVGGLAKNMHAHKREAKITGRGATGKAIVHGLLQRGGRNSVVKAVVAPNTEQNTLQTYIRRNVAWGSRVYTDASPSYIGLDMNYHHYWVDHLTRYVRDRVHVNGMENYFSLLKRAIRGTYVWCAAFHLHRYVDEQAFRFNHRKTSDLMRFVEVLCNVAGKRLTYRVLTAKDDAGFMGIK
jgi:transposase-like protein